jgi:hypothetical protein
MNRSKIKGTSAETAVVNYMRGEGFPHVERRALAGNSDRGDLAGVPGLVVEIKNCAKTELAAWVDEARIEQTNDRADLGVVWHKRRGKGSPADWFVTMSGAQFADILRQLGYGTGVNREEPAA